MPRIDPTVFIVVERTRIDGDETVAYHEYSHLSSALDKVEQLHQSPRERGVKTRVDLIAGAGRIGSRNVWVFRSHEQFIGQRRRDARNRRSKIAS